VLRQRRGERESKELATMTELGQALSKLTLVIKVKTGDDGKLFGSVTSRTIADELKHQFDAVVDKRRIHLPHPIKNAGDHEAELRLHQQVQVTLKVKIESTTPPPVPTEAAPAGRTDGGRGREGREGREGRREQGRAPAEAKPEGKAEARPERKPRAAKAE